MFRTSQYLNDTACQKAMAELARNWPRDDQTAQRLIASFHPLSTDELKDLAEVDGFFLQKIQDVFVRTHFVKRNGVAYTNPPPADYHCDSCHTKGWLRKDFQDSKLDGANIPVWLCRACTKLDPGKRDIRF